jgi:hypothetical protein
MIGKDSSRLVRVMGAVHEPGTRPLQRAEWLQSRNKIFTMWAFANVLITIYLLARTQYYSNVRPATPPGPAVLARACVR